MKCCLQEEDESNVFDYPVSIVFQTRTSMNTLCHTNELAQLVKRQMLGFFSFAVMMWNIKVIRLQSSGHMGRSVSIFAFQLLLQNQRWRKSS